MRVLIGGLTHHVPSAGSLAAGPEPRGLSRWHECTIAHSGSSVGQLHSPASETCPDGLPRRACRSHLLPPPELWPDLDGWFSTRHFHSNPDLSEKQRRQQREETPARPSSLTPGSTGLGGVGRHRPRWASAMLHQDRGSGGTQTPGGRLLATPDASCELSRALQGLA